MQTSLTPRSIEIPTTHYKPNSTGNPLTRISYSTTAPTTNTTSNATSSTHKHYVTNASSQPTHTHTRTQYTQEHFLSQRLSPETHTPADTKSPTHTQTNAPQGQTQGPHTPTSLKQTRPTNPISPKQHIHKKQSTTSLETHTIEPNTEDPLANPTTLPRENRRQTD